MENCSFKGPFQANIVDDDPDIAGTIADGIGTAFCDTLDAKCFSEPETALAHIQSSKVDIVICDQMMPGLLGQTLISKMKQHNSGAFYLLCTGKANLTLAMSARESGIHGMIEKPFELSSLTQTIGYYVGILNEWSKVLKNQVEKSY